MKEPEQERKPRIVVSGAIPAIIILIVSVIFAFPDELQVGRMIIDKLYKSSGCDTEQHKEDAVCDVHNDNLRTIRILSVAVFLINTYYIIDQIKKKRFLKVQVE